MSSALEDLADRDEQVAQAQHRARSVGRDLAESNAKIGKLKQDKVEAHSREDEQLATKIRRQIDVAAAKVIDLEERQAGAQLAAGRADSERRSGSATTTSTWSPRSSPTRSGRQKRSTSSPTSCSMR